MRERKGSAGRANARIPYWRQGLAVGTEIFPRTEFSVWYLVRLESATVSAEPGFLRRRPLGSSRLLQGTVRSGRLSARTARMWARSEREDEVRTALAVIVGYMTLVIVAMASRLAAFMVLGLEGAFEPGSYLPSGRWIAISFVLGFVAAVIGGYVCAAVSRDAGGPNLLAAAVLALGLVSAGFTLWERVEGPYPIRPPGVEITEAVRNAVQPGWVAFINPFIGVAGILLGCRLRRRSGK
jgi:hypothetical protein